MPRFDLARDCRLILAPGEIIVGYARLWETAPGLRLQGEWTAHPEHDRDRLGSVMFHFAEDRALELAAAVPSTTTHSTATPAPCLAFTVPAVDLTKAAILERNGYPRVRTYYRMSIDLAAGTPPLRDPAAFTIRTHRLGQDDRAAHETIESSFATHFGFVARPFDLWWAQHTTHERFEPALWIHAWEGERMVGSLLAYDFSDLGFVREIGTLDTHRGKGIASALLLRAFAAFHARGQNTVVLGVDAGNDTGAQRLYERVGMRVDQEYWRYERPLPAGPGPARAGVDPARSPAP